MLDVGWTELVVIAVVLIIVVGPKDLPPMLRTFGRMMTKMRGMANDFRQQFDEALKEADLDDVRQTLSDAQKLNPANTLREAMNPLRQMGNEIKADLQKATTVDPKPEATPETAAAEPAPAAPLMTPTPAVVPPAPVEPVTAAPLTEKPKRVAKPKVSETVVAPKKPATKKASAADADVATAQPKPKKTTAKATKTGDA
ncbi:MULTISPECIES: Sec-independent protein translocase protein TatB [unclassified Rhizobium]|uniref:Sec-independent protein translocase protein TatB n=1 Tax=unclassified Rhizobium TaxID=2613769 RepID=UPI0007009913|nr:MULTISPECIES: Sec-independent protein translocase protein TatB [unclassified Rhizobium]KQV33085.1 preprotein translocase [Rhizobium sp. Root1212]KRD21545.1 preprotein translocase [Rhizobium sp. Root268]